MAFVWIKTWPYLHVIRCCTELKTYPALSDTSNTRTRVYIHSHSLTQVTRVHGYTYPALSYTSNTRTRVYIHSHCLTQVTRVYGYTYTRTLLHK